MTTLDLLREASIALVRAVDGLGEEELGAASALPGWTRAHVVAHLALNAEGLARALEAHRRGSQVPQYDSQAAREDDIETLAAAPTPELRARFLASTTRFEDAVASLHPEHWQGKLTRVPGGQSFPVEQVPLKRLLEVAVHHVDLAVGHGRELWTPELAASLVDSLARRLRRGPHLRLEATDVARSWPGAGAGPVVTGPAADLAWWLSGRGAGEGLVCEPGPLPTLGPW